ncbi:MAG: hypothetical protein EWM45_07475 [Rhodopseudomonas palustris]|nr:MAG: hypothetical protein EWM45_07475 [Rhodopseudomonas palustris]
MASASRPTKPLRVLLSEGGSTSAREAITLLGLAGHHVEICDPSPRCFGRMSRFVRAFHRCPGLRSDPLGYLSFVEELLARRPFDVLLPIHEQGLLFAKVQHRLRQHTALALPSFASYRTALDKATFSAVLSELGLPQPVTTIVDSLAAARTHAVGEAPLVIKAAIGTASRGVWLVRNADQRAAAFAELDQLNLGDGQILLQQWVDAPVEHAQAVFRDGELLALHGYQRLIEGAGGGPALKQSVRRDLVRTDLARLGRHLGWHGAMSLDYLWHNETALYIDCNPRLVEPMSAALAGCDLLGALLQVSLGEASVPLAPGREGVRSHLAMQVLLGAAQREGSRRALLRELHALLTQKGAYQGSVEELTPWRLDWLSAVPLAATALLLLTQPRLAETLAAKGWGEHLLDTDALRTIERDVR